MRSRALRVSRSEVPAFGAWWQLHVFGLRVHHGAAGAALVVGAFVPRRLAARLVLLGLGAALMVHDRADYPWLP